MDLATVKKHLNLDSAYTEDDAYITSLMTVAEAVVAKDVNVDDLTKLADSGGTIPAPLSQAQLLFIGNMYQNREVVGAKTNKLPYNYEFLIDLYRNYEN